MRVRHATDLVMFATSQIKRAQAEMLPFSMLNHHGYVGLRSTTGHPPRPLGVGVINCCALR